VITFQKFQLIYIYIKYVDFILIFIMTAIIIVVHWAKVKGEKKKPIKIYIHNIVLKFMFIFSLCIYRCHTSRFSEFFFLYSLLHNRYKKKRKKNLISRSIISSVSDNDKRNITSFFFFYWILIVMHTRIYLYLYIFI